MDPKDVIVSQYLAALTMLEKSVQGCPAEMWDAPQDHNRFWRVAYHALFYTHLYLQPTLDDFRPWPAHREDVHDLSKPLADSTPYALAQVLEYLAFCRQEAARCIRLYDLDAPSGFPWCPFNKLEMQFYNIRHVQQHTGELMERLGQRAGVNVEWVSRGVL
jgi:hypothetical protein